MKKLRSGALTCCEDCLAIENAAPTLRVYDFFEVGEALFWDWQYVEVDENPDYKGLVKIILAIEKIVPDVRKNFYEAVLLYGCEESPSFLDLKQLLEGSNTKD